MAAKNKPVSPARQIITFAREHGWTTELTAHGRVHFAKAELSLLGPLRCGKKGCHEPGNLQILSRFANASKNNRCQKCWEAYKAERTKECSSMGGSLKSPETVALVDGYLRVTLQPGDTLALTGRAA